MFVLTWAHQRVGWYNTVCDSIQLFDTVRVLLVQVLNQPINK